MIATYTHVPIEPVPSKKDSFMAKDFTGDPTLNKKKHSFQIFQSAYLE